ncbi:MAG: hypothetical protein FWC87_04780 [Acidimicrobiaceae bacterium]|nr:hypothetical protein [Acidimicrobiaceae bacterium]
MPDAAVALAEPPEEVEAARAVLSDLRRARRRQRTRDFDPFEALYRVYITAILSGIVIWLASGITGDTKVPAATAAHVAAHDAQWVGLVVAVAWAVGLRSGGQGGPLAIEAADVRHVLLAPVERSVALRPVAIRQLRFAALVGSGVGAVAGLLAFRRLPGGFPAWVVAGAAVGLLVMPSSLSLAMLVSGRRLGRYVGGGLALVVLAWAVVDLVTHVTTSPTTFLGQLALWPLRTRLTALIGVAVSLAAVAAGLTLVPGSSLEAAERRATLVGQIRFAATLRDLRTVMVLRRQLSQELPRRRPWFRLPRAGRWPAWRRGWHGILRFPALRLARLAVLGAGAGAACVGIWRGTAPLVIVAGLCMYVAGLDAGEALAQEIDHPDRRETYDLANGELEVRLLAPSVAVMAAVAAVGVVTAYLVSGATPLAAELGGVMFIPCALTGLAGATISVVQGAPANFSSATSALLPPEANGFRAIFRMVWPPAVAIIGFLPLFAARHLQPGQGTRVGRVAGLQPLILILVVLVAVWVRYRDDIHAWFAKTMEEAKAAQRPAGPQR